MQVKLVSLLAGLGTVALSFEASAEIVVGGSLDWVVPIERDYAENGYGLQARVGKRLDGTLIVLTGEVLGSHASFTGPAAPSVTSGLVGGRVGLGLGLRPSLFTHVGVSSLQLNDSPLQSELIGEHDDLDEVGLIYDVGVALEFTLLPLLDVGAEVAYVNAAATEPNRFDWVRAGLSGTLVF